jgi:pyridoxamine 5'-phosphate oxidase family protein
MFNDRERAYLSEFRLARLATVDEQGHPHVVPTGFSFNTEDGTIAVSGHQMERTRKFRNAQANPHVAIVIDDLASTNPWRPRAIEIRGRAERKGETPTIGPMGLLQPRLHRLAVP